MHKPYVCRGIIKWSPYDALAGYQKLFNDLKYKLGKKEKPMLSDDDYEQLNRQLNHASKYQYKATISYYRDGYIYTLTGFITKLDYTYKKIIIDFKHTIDAYQIIDIHTEKTHLEIDRT